MLWKDRKKPWNISKVNQKDLKILSEAKMGRETKNFRQTNKSNKSNASAKNYAQINRAGNWTKIINVFKKGDKV